MQARSSVLLSISFVLAVSSAQAAGPVAYDFCGRMGLYHQSWILEKTPLAKQGVYRVRTRRVDNTGVVETQEGEVDCDPASPSVTGDLGKFEGKVFAADYEVSGVRESVYNLLWAVCRGGRFQVIRQYADL
jgi:hypothetical protein